jgi:CRP-like cAMP-binding protein
LQESLIEAEQPIPYVWLPRDMISSTVQPLRDGSSVEAGLMGIEGLIGLPLWLRRRPTPQLTTAQVPGRARRLAAETFLREAVQRPESPLNGLGAASTHACLVMTGQVAACNRLPAVNERLCRWLCHLHHRIPHRREFPLRQAYLAQLLGGHRPSVSMAASLLQEAGWIRYSRGTMELRDPTGLESGACECLEIREAPFDPIFEQPWLPLAWREQATNLAGDGHVRRRTDGKAREL